MMRDPWQAEVPEVAIADIVAFLVAGHPERDRSVRRLPPATPLATDAFVETPYIFGSSARLFGVLTAPTGHAGVGRPVVLLPNVGSNHHIGPNRMMVTLARRLASAGFRVFRFDIAGIGDGHPVPGQAENRLYSPASVADAQAAITFLGEAAGTDRVAFVGLCSGAYLAYHTAAVDPRVQEQVLINLQTFLWREGDSLELALRGSYRSSLYYRSALGRRESWRRLVRGEINVRGIVGVTVRRVAGRVAASLKQLVSADARRVARQFREVARRGGGSFLIYSSEDGGIDEMERQLGSAASRAAGLPKFKLALIEHADHTFTQASARHQLIDTLVSHLTQRYPVAAP
jgi:dienelactone hydrolase